MSSLNKVTLIGRLGADPDIRYTQDGKAVARISLATTEYSKSKDGERKETTSWHRVVMFDKKAELAEKYLEKGSLVFIEGKLRYGKYEKDGQTHYTTDIVATDLRFLPSGNGGSEQSSEQRKSKPAPAPQPEFADDFDDDIPF